MPRKQPPSIVRTVYQVRWWDPTKKSSEKLETYYLERVARERFDELSRTGARVRLFQTLRTVKLTMVDESPFDADVRAAHLEAEAARRSAYATSRWNKLREGQKRRQGLVD